MKTERTAREYCCAQVVQVLLCSAMRDFNHQRNEFFVQHCVYGCLLSRESPSERLISYGAKGKLTLNAFLKDAKSCGGSSSVYLFADGKRIDAKKTSLPRALAGTVNSAVLRFSGKPLYGLSSTIVSRPTAVYPRRDN